MNFDLGKWHGEFLFLYGRYLDLRSFFTDKNAIYSHVTENKVVTGIENGEIFESNDIKKLEEWIEPKTEVIERAFETFELQIPVIFSSYLEDAIVTFLTIYFSSNNRSIANYVNPLNEDNIKGFVHIKDILKHKDLDELKMTLASRSAHNAASGKSKKKVFRRIEELTECQIPKNVKENIISLYDKRNQIVHENIKDSLGKQYIEKIYDDCILLISELGKICVTHKLPHRDPTKLIEKCT